MRMNSKLRTIITNYQDPNSWISRRRARRVGPLLKIIRHVYGVNGKVRLIDLGGHRDYWNIISRDFLEQNKVSITLVNLPSNNAVQDDNLFHHHTGDACNLTEFANNSFDIVHSNSVIEHVGDWTRIKRFAKESRRLAPYHFIQTPYFWFPIEPHYLRAFHHWGPWPWRARRHFKHQASSRTDAHRIDVDQAMANIFLEPFLLDFRAFRFLFPDSAVHSERVLGIVIKSLIAVRAPIEEKSQFTNRGVADSQAGR